MTLLPQMFSSCHNEIVEKVISTKTEGRVNV